MLAAYPAYVDGRGLKGSAQVRYRAEWCRRLANPHPLGVWEALEGEVPDPLLDVVRMMDPSGPLRLRFARLLLSRGGGRFSHAHVEGATFVPTRLLKAWFHDPLHRFIKDLWFTTLDRNYEVGGYCQAVIPAVDPWKWLSVLIAEVATSSQVVAELEEVYCCTSVVRLLEELCKLRSIPGINRPGRLDHNIRLLESLLEIGEKDGDLLRLRVSYVRALDHTGKPRKGGRLYGVGPCMARLSADVRVRVLPVWVVIVDIRAAHPTIQFQLAAHHGFLAESMMEFTPDGDIEGGRRRVAQEVGVSVETAKNLVTSLIYGAGLQRGVKAAVNASRLEEQRDPVANVESTTLAGLYRDAKVVGELIVPKDSHFAREASQRAASNRQAGNHGSSAQKTASALRTQDAENGCLMAMATSVGSMNWTSRAFILDALAFDLEQDELDDKDLANELSRDIEELTACGNGYAPPGTRGFTGFSLELSVKRGGVKAPLPNKWKETR